MKKLLYLSLIFLCMGCSHKKDTPKLSMIDGCKVTAHRIAESFDMIECDLGLVKQKMDIPLSDLVSDVKLIKLENTTKEMMVSSNDNVCISEHYIVAYGSGSLVSKLFDTNGKFIAYIGSIGNGPGEYSPWVETVQIDEEEGLIYQTTITRQDEVNVYSLKTGRYIENIPLAEQGNRARLLVDATAQRITVLHVPMPHIKNIVWQQDFSGKIIHSVPAQSYMDEAYTNSVYGWNPGCVEPVLSQVHNKLTAGFIHYFPTKDSLYVFDGDKLTPYFTIRYRDNANPPFHTVDETEHCFLITLYKDDGMFKILDKRILLDKKTLRGCETDLYLDALGDMPIDFIPTFQGNFLFYNFSPDDLQEKIEAALKLPHISNQKKMELEELLNKIQPDDNNYILIGKLK